MMPYLPHHLHSSLVQWKLTSKEEALSSVPAGFLSNLQMKWVVSSAIAMKSYYPVLAGSQEKWPCSVLLCGLPEFPCAPAHEVPHTVPGIELFCLIKMIPRGSIIQLCICRIFPCSYFFFFGLSCYLKIVAYFHTFFIAPSLWLTFTAWSLFS